MAGIDSYTKLMLHCDGADASPTFLDGSLSPYTVTSVGTAQIDTAQSVFGGASGLFDGNSDYLTIPDADDWNFASENFTIDFRINFHVKNATNILLGQYVDAIHNWRIQWNNDNKLYFYVSNGSAGTLNYSVPFTPSVDTWYHFEFARNANNWYTFINGVAGTKTLNNGSYSSSMPDVASVLYVANAYPPAIYYLNGWMDEIRISKGIARHTTNFTPPTEAYNLTLTETVKLIDTIKFTVSLPESEIISDNLDFFYPPLFRNLIVLQSIITGQVEINYEVYFNHFESADNELDVKFQYWNGSSWIDCTTTTGEGTITITPGEWNSLAGTWNAKLDIPETYYSNTKIRVLASYL